AVSPWVRRGDLIVAGRSLEVAVETTNTLRNRRQLGHVLNEATTVIKLDHTRFLFKVALNDPHLALPPQHPELCDPMLRARSDAAWLDELLLDHLASLTFIKRCGCVHRPYL